MKLNNLQKNFCIFFSVIISILIATLVWGKINLPINNTFFTKDLLISRGYNPINDTIKYIFFVSVPLITFLFLNQVFKKKTIQIKELIFEKGEKSTNCHPAILILSFIFIIFIFLEFFSVNFPLSNLWLDQMHDGTFLTPTQNYLSTKKFWMSSYLVHGGADLFYPLLTWKILGVESIGATRTFTIFLILLVKLLSVLLSYQFAKISKLNKETKILFFAIFTSILISMSNYTFLGKSYYISWKDIYIVSFLIFFIELFINSKFRSISIILICFIATTSILFQIDKGAYINFILIFYCFYLLLEKKYKDILLIFFSLIVFWSIVITVVGFDEFIAYLHNTKTIMLSMDWMHGLNYPEPFFSMGNNSDGARATKGLLIQIAAGLFVLNYLISNEKKIFSSKKMLFAFLFILSFIMYKNALGRSDGTHIRDSNDVPILICSFFILNYLLILLEKILFKKEILSTKISFTAAIFFLISFNIYHHDNYNINNIKNYKKNFTKFVNLEDKNFLQPRTAEFINYYKQLTKNDNCVTNITYELDAISYLLKKPTCNKYWSAWLTSPIVIQKDYINKIKKIKSKYVLYRTSGVLFDGIELHQRIKLINSYILSNYQEHSRFDEYIILEKK